MTGTSKVFVMIAMAGAVLALAQSRPKMKRVGMVIGIKAEKIAAYKALHAASNPGVRDLLIKYHIRNFSIYLQRLDDGNYYLFGYYEYDGNNYAADMAKLAAEKRNIEWLSVTDALQNPLRGQKTWVKMEEVFHNE